MFEDDGSGSGDDGSSTTSDVFKGAGQGAAMGSAFGPWGAAIGSVVGIGLSLFGSAQKAQAAAAQTKVQTEMVNTEMQQNQLRNQVMNMVSQRQQLQNVRNMQRARSLALSNATDQGAQFGSALPGGYGQISGAGQNISRSLSQDLQAGNQMFNLENDLSMEKIQMAQLGTKINTGSMYSGLGQLASSSGKQVGQLTGSAYNFAMTGNFG